LLKDTASLPFYRYYLPVIILFLISLILALSTGILQGLFFSRLRPTITKLPFSFSGKWINRMLLTFQIAASIVLLISILVIYKQMKFIDKFDTGINAENVLIVNRAHGMQDHYEVFKTEILKSSLVKAIAHSNSYPLNWMTTSSFTTVGQEEKYPYPFQYFRADNGFMDVFGFNLSEGRWFSELNGNDRSAVLLNEAAVKAMRLKNPVGSQLYRTDLPSEKLQVIGVIHNFNFRSLHYSVEPLIICPVRNGDWWNFIEIKGSTNDRKALLAYVRNIWSQATGNDYMDYTFLDDLVLLQYKKELRIRQSVSMFCLIAILISCFGLLGTILNQATEKTKEIGIRKVNGARIADIIALFNRNFIFLVAIAFILACPVAWYIMSWWLHHFAYKTGLSWWIFALAGGVTFAITMVIVSWQSWRTARMNPVEALRYE
jgi:putative ABC transport system permease protein